MIFKITVNMTAFSKIIKFVGVSKEICLPKN